MGHFDEVCLLCGISPSPPSGFSNCTDIAAEELVESLLEHFPTILEESQVENAKSEEDLQEFLNDIMDEIDLEYSESCGAAFGRWIAFGYFDDDSDEGCPHEDDSDPIVKRKIPDGKFVTTRAVDWANCGDFEREVIRKTDVDGAVVEQLEKIITRTGSYWQQGIGNFFLSGCCFQFLQAWIPVEGLPPMWDGRKLSFAGELWEVLNSRETGRSEFRSSTCRSMKPVALTRHSIDDIGFLDWLDPGGAEQKLEQTQYELATGGARYPSQIAKGLREGYDKEDFKPLMLEDYGYWMFTRPHEYVPSRAIP
jgi:hypothetical protein